MEIDSLKTLLQRIQVSLHSAGQPTQFNYTSQLFINIPDHCRLYRTGDYASVQNDGIIHFEGRMDSQVKIRGHRVDLSEVQKHLLEFDGVDKAIVLCYHVGQMDQTVLAFVSFTSQLNSKQKSLKTIQIEDFLRNKLVDYMVPQVMIVDGMPLLVNGKIDRQTLLQTYSDINNNGKFVVIESKL